MAGVKLLEEARAAGLKVHAEGDRLIVRGPKSAEHVAKTLLEKKAEVLPLLAAVTWLRSKLSTPQHIAPLIAEWAGERDGSTGRFIDDLMAARWALDVQAYEGEDGRLWWRLSETAVQ